MPEKIKIAHLILCHIDSVFNNRLISNISGYSDVYIHVDFYDHHHKFNQWFYFVANADELYFATVIYNSKFAATTFDGEDREGGEISKFFNLVYFEYPYKIKILTKDDYNTLLASDCLYARKFVSGVSDEVLDMIDREMSNIN